MNRVLPYQDKRVRIVTHDGVELVGELLMVTAYGVTDGDWDRPLQKFGPRLILGSTGQASTVVDAAGVDSITIT